MQEMKKINILNDKKIYLFLPFVVPLDAPAFFRHKLNLLAFVIGVIKEELFAGLDVLEGENADFMVAIHHYHFGAAIGVLRVVGEADNVAFTGCVHGLLVV